MPLDEAGTVRIRGSGKGFAREIPLKMMKLSRNRRAAALAAALAGLWTGALAAQDNVTVGNPQLKDFQLGGQRTTPPAQVQPAAPAPAPTTARTAPQTTTPITTPATTRATAPSTSARTTTRRPSEPTAPAATRTSAPTPAPVTATPAPVAQAPAPVSKPAPQAAAPAPMPQEATPPALFNLNWLWLALPVLLGLGALLLFRRRRGLAKRDEVERGALAGALRPSEAPEPEPEPAPVPEPAPAVVEAPRPWLELDIAPARASSTESATTIDFELVVTNTGNEIARNIRIDMRMFNAADEQQIAAFLGGPIHRHSGSPHVTIAPGENMRLTADVGMKAEEVRAIELQDRRIFVPAIAMNVAYDWGEDGEGRSSRSWLVGRKPESPAARMGAFRLDLGPRIYRSVERRDAKRMMV